MEQLLDAHGHEFRAGDTAYVVEWSAAAPLPMPYVWRVVSRHNQLFVQPRPDGEAQLLTPALGRALRCYHEPSFARPEAHASSWKRLLRLGWVIHAEQAGSKPEYVFHARRATPALGHRNTLQLVITATSLHHDGYKAEYRAGFIWKHLLKEAQAASMP